MSRKVVRYELPWAYEGMDTDPVHWRNLGYQVVVEGEPLHMEGVDLPPLWRWFTREDNPHALRVARFGCAGCSKPTPVAILEIVRDDPGRAEPVAVVTYQQSRARGVSREVVVCRAVLHLPAPGTNCQHGRLLAHPSDAPVTTFCRGCGDQSIPWARVVETIRRAGGWGVTEADLKPSRDRVVSLR